MYRLFDKAMLWELLDVQRNLTELVEVKGISKRRSAELSLRTFWTLLRELSSSVRGA